MDNFHFPIGRFFLCYDHSVTPIPWARASAALIAVFLQLPAFFSACTPLPDTLPPTKADAPGREPCLDVFFFDDDSLGRLDAYQRFTLPWPDTLPALSRTGPKRMVVLTNTSEDPYAWSGIRSRETLAGEAFNLEDEDPALPREWGELHILDGGAVRAADIALRPMLCRIVVNSLSCDFSDRPYRGAVLQDVKAYLTHVRTQTHPLRGEADRGGSWINPGYLDPAALAAFSHSELILAPVAESVGEEPLFPAVTLSCYPNPAREESLGTPVTTLVIEGMLLGSPTYYPIRLGALEAGVSYQIDLCFTRAGAGDPDSPVASGTFTLRVQAAPWNHRQETVIRYE